jgi:hypothetical protein
VQADDLHLAAHRPAGAAANKGGAAGIDLGRAARWRRSVFVGQKYSDDGFALVAGAADGLQPDQRRGALLVAVADVDAEANLRAAVAPADGQPQQE